jgi:hypothetical protein
MTASSTRVGRSATGLGLFATKPIKRGATIVTYRGRRISTAEAERREARGARYMFYLNRRWTIDGSMESGALHQPFLPTERGGGGTQRRNRHRRIAPNRTG